MPDSNIENVFTCDLWHNTHALISCQMLSVGEHVAVRESGDRQ